MEVLNYTEFRKNLTKSLNKVNDHAEIVVVSRSKGKNVVVMDLEQYNSMQETMYLTSTVANSRRLEEAIQELETGKHATHSLIEN